MDRSASHYTPFFLHLYDFVVLTFTNSLCWACSTVSVLQPFFNSLVGPRHMDIGVGTGYFPRKHREKRPEWPSKLLLVDLNKNCTAMAAARVDAPQQTEILIANALYPLPLPVPGSESEKYDSISLMYLIHCLSGSMKEKTRVFENLRPWIKQDGVLFGATILAKGVKHNLLGWIYLKILNASGVLNNWDDSRDEISRGLERNFAQVDTVVVGRVLLFTARRPRRG